MNITNIKISLVGEVKLKAYVSITIEDNFVLNDMRIVKTKNGLTVFYPDSPYHKDKVLYCPLNEETRLQIETAVLDMYKSMVE